MFGYMALHFKTNFIDRISDKSPSVANTVRRVITYMRDTFYDQSNEMIRNACAMSMHEILEHCFVNRRFVEKGTE